MEGEIFVDKGNLTGMLNDILQSGFFAVSCSFTGAQLKAGDDRICLLQSMVLLDTKYVTGFERKDFSADSVLRYWESIRDDYSDRQSNMLKSAIQYLTDAFQVRDKGLKKINIPIVVYISDVAMDAGIIPTFFRRWWEVLISMQNTSIIWDSDG